MTTISKIVTERVNIITAILNKRQAINRFKYNSDEWHTEFNALYPLHIDQLKALNN